MSITARHYKTVPRKVYTVIVHMMLDGNSMKNGRYNFVFLFEFGMAMASQIPIIVRIVLIYLRISKFAKHISALQRIIIVSLLVWRNNGSHAKTFSYCYLVFVWWARTNMLLTSFLHPSNTLLNLENCIKDLRKLGECHLCVFGCMCTRTANCYNKCHTITSC